DEFVAELDKIRARARGNTRKELMQLLLMALEREEMVTHAYRAALIEERLERMPVPEEVRRLIRHAMLWVWADEDMHVVYTRGALMRVGNFWLKNRAMMSQAAGAIGGWAASVVQHVRFWDAPFSWCWARVVTGLGKLTGKVPKEVRQHLRYGAFRDFCLFNVEAEDTAAVCWERIVDLARSSDLYEPRQIEDIERVVFDENRHSRVFKIFAEALDENDALKSGHTAESIAAQVREVSVYFLPREMRGLNPTADPLGSGGELWALEDTAEPAKSGKFAHFQQLLDTCDLEARLASRTAQLGKAPAEMRVVIKASFMMGYHRADTSPISDPESLHLLGVWLAERGYTDVVLLDAENIYDRFYANRDVETVADYFGIQSPHFRVVNASQAQVQHAYARGMGAYGVSRHWKEADFRLTFGKLRSHPTELVMLSIANLEWLGGRCEEFIFIDRQADRRTTTMMILDEFPPHYALVEAYDDCPDGLVGIMGCKRPKSPRRHYAGADALSLDLLIVQHLGLPALPRGCTLAAARHWFGDWAPEATLHGTNLPIPQWRNPTRNRLWGILSLLSFPVYVFFSRRGSLFV
ncbi:MAG: hypothetical protein AAF570_18975, partial [Bacteroidota bacterium]